LQIAQQGDGLGMQVPPAEPRRVHALQVLQRAAEAACCVSSEFSFSPKASRAAWLKEQKFRSVARAIMFSASICASSSG